MTNTTDFELNENIVKVWSYRWLSCVSLGGMAFTFALMAIISALQASIQMSISRLRSRLPRSGIVALAWRDGLALALLCGHPAHFALGLVAAWFGTENLHNFIFTNECTSLVVVGVASQWNMALSTPVVTLYYALTAACPDPVSPLANQSSGHNMGTVRQGRTSETRGAHRAEVGGEQVEITREDRRSIRKIWLDVKRYICHSWWTGALGILTLVGVVNSLTLVVTRASLSGIVMEVKVEDSLIEDTFSKSFCSRFFGWPEFFPRRTMGAVFMASVAVSAGAILFLSRELDRRGKRRHTVDILNSGDMARLHSFTRPPDEGAHFHHYAHPPHMTMPFGGEGAIRQGDYGQVNSRAGALEWAGGEDRRMQMTASDGAMTEEAFLGSNGGRDTSTDSEFYDAERTRHRAQSPPPNHRLVPRSHGVPMSPFYAQEHSAAVHSSSHRMLTGLPTDQTLENQLSSPNEIVQGSNELSSFPYRPLSVDSMNDDTRQSNNQNARDDELSVEVTPSRLLEESSSSGETNRPDPGTDRTERDRDLDSIWERLQQMRLVDLIFPHRHTEANKKRFGHTKVEHVREEIIPPSIPSSSSRDHLMTGTLQSALSAAHTMTCHIVCVSGALFVLTYAFIAFYLLLTDAGKGWGGDSVQYRFVDPTFEPFLALVLTKAILDSFFCFAALFSLTPVVSTL